MNYFSKAKSVFLNILFMALSLALFSCQDFDHSEETTTESECVVTFQAETLSKDQTQDSSRQAMPSSISPSTLSYSLSYYKTDEPDDKHAIGESEHLSYYTLSQAQLLLSEGDWTFTLTAYRNSYPILAATVQKAIAKGANQISFTLEETDFNYGGINVTLSFATETEKAKTMAVYASLYQFTEHGTSENAVSEKQLEITTSSSSSSSLSGDESSLMGYWSVRYQAGVTEDSDLSKDKTIETDTDEVLDKTIETGTYILTFSFYDCEAKENLLGSYSEFVIVGAGAVSSSNCYIEDITDIYNIFYENVGDLDDYYYLNSLPTTFTSYKSVSLPDWGSSYGRYKDGYVFAGWYLESDFTGEAQTEIPIGTEHDVTLYAKWEVDLSYCSISLSSEEVEYRYYDGLVFSELTNTVTLAAYNRFIDSDVSDQVIWEATLKTADGTEKDGACSITGNTLTITFPSGANKISRTSYRLYVTAKAGEQSISNSFYIYQAAEYPNCSITGVSFAYSYIYESTITATLSLVTSDGTNSTAIEDDSLTWTAVLKNRDDKVIEDACSVEGNTLTITFPNDSNKFSYTRYEVDITANLGEGTLTRDFYIYKYGEYYDSTITLSDTTFTESPATAILSLVKSDGTSVTDDSITWSFKSVSSGLEGIISGNELTLTFMDTTSSASYSFYITAQVGDESIEKLFTVDKE